MNVNHGITQRGSIEGLSSSTSSFYDGYIISFTFQRGGAVTFTFVSSIEYLNAVSVW